MIFPLRFVRNSITKYLTSSGFIRKNWENCGGCLTVKNQWELLTGDDVDVISGSKEKECDAMDKYMDT